MKKLDNLKSIIKKARFNLLFTAIVLCVAVTAGVCHFINPYNIIKKTEKFYKA